MFVGVSSRRAEPSALVARMNATAAALSGSRWGRMRITAADGRLR
jgi:hypothetical protein